MNTEKLLYLKNKAQQLRIDSIRATTASKSGHPTSALSAADIVSTLFFYIMSYDPKNPKNPNNDRFILSKGHAIPVVYAAWKQVGVIDDKKLLSLRKFDSELEGHPTPRFKYNEAATGSLGQGLSIGIGQALNARLEKLSYKTYVMIGDGEAAEGSIWEAAEFASKYNLNNLIGIMDCNRLGQSGEAIHGHDTKKYQGKFNAFGWHSIIIDGHNIEEIITALETKTDKPLMIIAKTYKGHGLSDREDKNNFHGKPLTEDEAQKAIQSLQPSKIEPFHLKLPISTESIPTVGPIYIEPISDNFPTDIATRKAYGYGLAALGRASKDIIVLDADVKNSTFTDIFEKEFKDRFVQCFIAEQNMVSIATGLEIRGKIPFAATFGAFFTRAYDQIRMAGIGRNALRLCGSHCGVSIGEDGPSQMALEDISMIRSVPNSILFYPSDAISAYKITELMANYNDGISYMRTTRSATKAIYNKDEQFKIGGCKVIKKSDSDKVCIISAGITLHESLKAYDELAKENITDKSGADKSGADKSVNVSVIDLYCIKPLDIETILETAKNSTILTVEDHYKAGGIGEAVSSAVSKCAASNKVVSLYVKEVSRSGKSDELLRYAEIDSSSIVKTVKDLC